MESDWRYNVWLTGMSNSTFRLVARQRGVPFERYIALAIFPDGSRNFAADVGFSPTFGWQWVSVPAPVGVPFPFGVDVFPD